MANSTNSLDITNIVKRALEANTSTLEIINAYALMSGHLAQLAKAEKPDKANIANAFTVRNRLAKRIHIKITDETAVEKLIERAKSYLSFHAPLLSRSQLGKDSVFAVETAEAEVLQMFATALTARTAEKPETYAKTIEQLKAKAEKTVRPLSEPTAAEKLAAKAAEKAAQRAAQAKTEGTLIHAEDEKKPSTAEPAETSPTAEANVVKIESAPAKGALGSRLRGLLTKKKTAVPTVKTLTPAPAAPVIDKSGIYCNPIQLKEWATLINTKPSKTDLGVKAVTGIYGRVAGVMANTVGKHFAVPTAEELAERARKSAERQANKKAKPEAKTEKTEASSEAPAAASTEVNLADVELEPAATPASEPVEHTNGEAAPAKAPEAAPVADLNDDSKIDLSALLDENAPKL